MRDLILCPFCKCEMKIRKEHDSAFRLMPINYHEEDCYIERFAIPQPDFLSADIAKKCWNEGAEK